MYLEDCNNPTMPKLIILENISNNPVAKAIANLFCILYLSTVSRALSQNSSDMNLLGRLRTHYLMWQIGEKLKYISRDRCGLFLQFWFIVLLTCFISMYNVSSFIWMKFIWPLQWQLLLCFWITRALKKKPFDATQCLESRGNSRRKIYQFLNCRSDSVLQTDTWMR